ncbi:hypothetical protein B0H17DRAFT_933889 [Mycena rosella]|uniref:Uncharacterized protein n=1 Tax=Mycena rosella TaxID=1033263 RepID=A0AAD7GIK9_MYCRO|nr:hypothetical protein B0H17DRAFT_933889 [Mycena rosella]
MSEPTYRLTFPRLNEKNYGTWTEDERGKLQRLGVWLIVKGAIVAPTTNDAESELRKWLVDSGKAAGYIYSSIEPSQKVHAKGMEENPIGMWSHWSGCINRRSRERDSLHTIIFSPSRSYRHRPEETLTQLIRRVDDAVSLIKDLRPPSHTLDDLDGELASMAMIRALPEEFKAFPTLGAGPRTPNNKEKLVKDS